MRITFREGVNVELRDRTGFSVTRAHPDHRTGRDRHWLRPNELLTLRLWRLRLCVFWPCRRDGRAALKQATHLRDLATAK